MPPDHRGPGVPDEQRRLQGARWSAGLGLRLSLSARFVLAAVGRYLNDSIEAQAPQRG